MPKTKNQRTKIWNERNIYFWKKHLKIVINITFECPPYLLCVCILLSVSNYCGWERRFCIPKTQLVQLYGLWSKSHCCTPCHRQRLLSFREGGSSNWFFKFLMKIKHFYFWGLQVILNAINANLHKLKPEKWYILWLFIHCTQVFNLLVVNEIPLFLLFICTKAF